MTVTSSGSTLSQPTAATTTALRTVDVRKAFGGTVALAGANFEVRPGEIHALLGENGAGKSTLVKIVAGVETADAGSVSVLGHDLGAGGNPHAVRDLGVAFIHQQLGLVETLSVAENVAMTVGYPRGRFGVDDRALEQRTRDALSLMGIDISPDELVAALPTSLRTVVAIARALAMEAQLLVLDEPTASLPAMEVSTLFAAMRRLRDAGVSMVLISHRLDEVREICDRATILRDGVDVATVDARATSTAQLVQHILGHAMEDGDSGASPVGHNDAAVLSVQEIKGPGIGPLSFEVVAGEILGITGVVGAGQSRLAGVLLGMSPLTSGAMVLGGRPYGPTSVRQALAEGLAHVPSDRARDGTIATMSLLENLFPNPPRTARYSLRKERARAVALLRDFDVRPANPDAELSTLSGGNAQKVVLARCLSSPAKVFVLEDPTQGVDVGARAQIHDRLRRAAHDGAAIVLITADFEEAANVCHRVLVMDRTRIRREFRDADVTLQNLTRTAHAAAV